MEARKDSMRAFHGEEEAKLVEQVINSCEKDEAWASAKNAPKALETKLFSTAEKACTRCGKLRNFYEFAAHPGNKAAEYAELKSLVESGEIPKMVELGTKTFCAMCATCRNRAEFDKKNSSANQFKAMVLKPLMDIMGCSHAGATQQKCCAKLEVDHGREGAKVKTLTFQELPNPERVLEELESVLKLDGDFLCSYHHRLETWKESESGEVRQMTSAIKLALGGKCASPTCSGPPTVDGTSLDFAHVDRAQKTTTHCGNLRKIAAVVVRKFKQCIKKHVKSKINEEFLVEPVALAVVQHHPELKNFGRCLCIDCHAAETAAERKNFDDDWKNFCNVEEPNLPRDKKIKALEIQNDCDQVLRSFGLTIRGCDTRQKKREQLVKAVSSPNGVLYKLVQKHFVQPSRLPKGREKRQRVTDTCV
jgi:hypothetical protein